MVQTAMVRTAMVLSRNSLLFSHLLPRSSSSNLAMQIRWQQPAIVQAGIDQTRLTIADEPTGTVPFSFAVMGDTDAGSRDSKTSSSFSKAFSKQLLTASADCRFLLHTGDVTYPTGSYENYLNGFLRPYQALLCGLPISPDRAREIVFKTPLLPVPGNHDYAEAAGLRGILARLVRVMCDRLRQTLNIDLGHYGGEGGEAYGRIFLDHLSSLSTDQLAAHLAAHYHDFSEKTDAHQPGKLSLNYRPGHFTRLPNRYYTFHYAGIDFFALDSNTWNSAPEDAGFDDEQLAWLEHQLICSWRSPNVIGRVIYLHHSPYTTEASRWQQSETLWVRRHLRTVLDKVVTRTGQQKDLQRRVPLVDLVLSGHAHCLEHLKTGDTGHADSYTDWIVCGGSGANVRYRRQSDTVEILETVSRRGRQYPGVVAKSMFYAGAHERRGRQQRLHSFIRIDVTPGSRRLFKVVPFVVTRNVRNSGANAVGVCEDWQTETGSAFHLGSRVLSVR
ncbi:metallophosphoesterase [cf. Phormidesmis sp. LEGE 11477]|uniref:metallophosphoesterase family protein n=1 Tax=cf. Phormidesmis sp. LEGE 11477 TaxID=1828680 RepID=UPI001882C54D|nr:metallophosphoesterase [cf. Phormidesmis sp. LEGE 11477]MBE9061350.1 metallophosphoesterase [cf. Phormidesmis sp. LEGE 11477]